MFVKNLYDSINDFIFYTSASKKSLVVTRWLLLAYLILLLLDFNSALYIYTMNNYILFKVMFGFIAVMNMDTLASILTRAFGGFTSKKLQGYVELKEKPQEATPLLDGIRLDDLIVFMTEKWWLPTEETRARFKMSHDQIKKLWDNLIRVGILFKNKQNNNRRELTTHNYTKIIDVLKQASDSDRLPTTPWDESQPQITVNQLKTAMATA